MQREMETTIIPAIWSAISARPVSVVCGIADADPQQGGDSWTERF